MIYPCSIRRSAVYTIPVSMTSISGRMPSSWARRPSFSRNATLLWKTKSPFTFMEPASMVAISGIRSKGRMRSSSGTPKPPAVVMLMTISHFSRMSATLSRNFSYSMLALPWSSRTCRCTTEAPAFQHS